MLSFFFLRYLDAGFKRIKDESFRRTFEGLFSEIDLAYPKPGTIYADRKTKLYTNGEFPS
jgi:type I restriction enzyme M protein